MKFRQAKKIIEGKSNLVKRFRKLRPPYTNERSRTVWPSWHDIGIVRRAMRVYLRHVKRNKKKNYVTQNN